MHQWKPLPLQSHLPINAHGKALPLLILVITAAILSVLVIFRPDPQPVPVAPALPPQLTAMVTKPSIKQVSVYSRGTVRPKHQADLVAEVSGRVVFVAGNFVNGGFFKAGDLLLKLDDRDYRNVLVTREAQVADAKRALAVERGQARLAKREWQDLGNEEGNELFLRKPQVAAAEAKLAAAIAELNQAKLNLQRTEVRAPFDGLLSQIDTHVGQYVTPGKALGRAFDIEVMEVPLPLTNRQMALVELPLHADSKLETPVTLVAQVAGERFEWQGKIVRTEASFDTQSRVIYAIAEVDHPYRSRVDGAPPLVAGMFVDAVVEGKSFSDVTKVPSSAVYQRSNVLTLDGQNHLRVTPVDMLQSGDDYALVRGLQVDQVVLLQRPTSVIEGITVTPILNNETPEALAGK